MTDQVAISGVCERDIDLLLLEEFLSATGFGEWFAQETKLPQLDGLHVETAGRSVTTSFGESDLEVMFYGPDGTKVMLLIENKISAGFQPSQAARYRQRGENYVSRRMIDEFHTILVAPFDYFEGNFKGFDARVDYEEILHWYETNPTLGLRHKYKVSLMNSALERARIGYQLKEDSVITDFWTSYWKLVETMDPNLRLPPRKADKGRPAGSNFVWFVDPTLPKDVNLLHKMVHGHFDLQFPRKGSQVKELGDAFATVLTPLMEVTKAAGSAAIRIRVPALQTAEPFRQQHQEAKTALYQGLQLRDWFLDHIELWNGFEATL